MGIIWAARSGCSLPAPTLDANMAAAQDSLATFSWLELCEESAARGGRAGRKRAKMRGERGEERGREERIAGQTVRKHNFIKAWLEFQVKIKDTCSRRESFGGEGHYAYRGLRRIEVLSYFDRLSCKRLVCGSAGQRAHSSGNPRALQLPAGHKKDVGNQENPQQSQ